MTKQLKRAWNWSPAATVLGICLLSMWAVAVFSQGQNFPGGSGAGITYVTTNPVTFTTGQTFFNTVTNQILCATSNSVLVSCGGGSAATGAINVTSAPYNTPLANMCENANLSVTSGSNNVTCSNYTFTSADIGKVAWVSCCGGFGGVAKIASVAYITQGVINSVVSAHVAAICTTTGACTPVNATSNTQCQFVSNGCQFYFGFDGTAGLQAAVTAAFGGQGPCSTLLIPGWVLVNTGIGNTTPTCQYSIGNVSDAGPLISGVGRNNSGIIAEPVFTARNSYAADCTGLGTVPSCMFGFQGKTIRYLTISGGEIGTGGTANHANAIITASTDDNFLDFGLCCWGGNDAQLIGLQLEGPGAYIENPVVDGAGAIAIEAQNAGLGPFNSLVGCFAGDTGGQTIDGIAAGSLMVKASASLFTTNCYFGQSGGARSIIGVDTGGFLDSVNDSILGTNANNNGADVKGTARFTNLKFATAANLVGLYADTAGTITASNSRIAGGSNSISGVAAGTFIDLCGNTFTGAVNLAGPVIVNCPSEPSAGGRCELASAASPLACGASGNGKVAVPATTTTYTINTIAARTGTEIYITPTGDNSGIAGGPTCAIVASPFAQITAISTGVSFTFSLPSNAGISCFNWSIR